MDIKGIIPAMVTPIKDNNEINYDATEILIEKLIANGCSAIFILGTNGEFHMMNTKQKIEFTDFTAKKIDGRVPLIVGTGGNSTSEVIELSKEIISVGADLLSIITPYFIRPSSEELRDHYLEIANNLKFPLMIYNIPKLTGISVEKDILEELATNEHIVGIKDSSGELENIKTYIQIGKDKKFNVLCGTDSLILDSLKEGGSGAVASTANVVPDIVYGIYNNWEKGNFKEAEKHQEQLKKIRELFSEGTIPSVLKSFVNHTGIEAGNPIAPIRPVDEKVEKKVIEVVKYFNNSRG